jgi:hypothetical protein
VRAAAAGAAGQPPLGLDDLGAQSVRSAILSRSKRDRE